MITEILDGKELNYAVAAALAIETCWENNEDWINGNAENNNFLDWKCGGPIIEREQISICKFSDKPGWYAIHPFLFYELNRFTGPTPLIAAMRCFVESKIKN